MSDTKNAKAVCILCADKLEFTLSLCLSRRLPFAINHTLSSAATLSLRQRIGATVWAVLSFSKEHKPNKILSSVMTYMCWPGLRGLRGLVAGLLLCWLPPISPSPPATFDSRHQNSAREIGERSPGPAGQSCCGSSTAAPPRSGSSSPRPCSSCPRSTPAATSLETTASQLHSCSTPEVREVGFTCI